MNDTKCEELVGRLMQLYSAYIESCGYSSKSQQTMSAESLLEWKPVESLINSTKFYF